MKNVKKLAKILIFCLALLDAVSSTPQQYKASDGREYLIETDQKYNWYQASHECARRNFQLVVIDSADKNRSIIRLLLKVLGKSYNLWLGGNDEYNTSRDYNRPFYWSATGERFKYTYWSENNPDNYQSQEHCVHIQDYQPFYQWNDIGCTNQMGFICEVNHYLENYEKQLKRNTCDAVKDASSSISSEFSKVKQ